MLPNTLAYKFARIEPYGFFIVLGLVFLQLVGYWVVPVMKLGRWIVDVMVLPFTFLMF
jgi:hypothetical protein